MGGGGGGGLNIGGKGLVVNEGMEKKMQTKVGGVPSVDNIMVLGIYWP